MKKFVPEKPSIYGENRESLLAALKEGGQPAFRADQVLSWLYKKRVGDWNEMANIPKTLREWLADRWTLQPLTRILCKNSSDVTDKMLFALEDQSLIETVLIRAPQIGVGQEKARHTVCVSIQVGCAYGCRFCASGLAGFKRNLTTAEVIAQLIQICHLEDEQTPRADKDFPSFDNIVFMGMGEPLANFDTLTRALEILNADWGFGFGARRITVSTSGLAPQIRQLADEAVPVRLAISLHGATDEVREQIMPINRKYPLAELLPAARYFAEQNKRMITLEFILIEDLNDSFEQASALAEIARDLHAHVNCIPYNTVQGLPWKRPSLKRQETFVRVLRKRGVSVTIRREKGHDIEAACGQLRLQTEQERGTLVSSG
ncbi:MAG: 23S rRNA (adenine(2503)-C(2))-methyltransferase RlmN [Opitutales bacterium]|nr:23S rRNA (adenine(2503)-C(2))-methyltransferase RlmN [Opitutales bacterium]